MAGPLAGVRILDCTTVVLGPWAAQQLGDLGADIIKIEPPEGDTTRQLGPRRNKDMAAFFLGCNRNKRSIVLDLKNDAGRAALFRLAETADVLMHNYRPEPAARLGVPYEAFQKINPRLIYLATYGYRAAGPMGAKAAYDDIIQAGSGLAMLQTVVAGAPRFLPTIVADKTSSNGVVSAVLAALYERERSGKGQSIEVPMFETLVSFVMVEHLYGETFMPAVEGAGYRRLLNKERRPYPSKDGFFALLPYTDQHWREFCQLIGRDDIMADARFKSLATRLTNIEVVYATLAEICATRTNAEWNALLKNSNVPHGPVNSLEDLLVDPQLQATGFWQEVEHPTEGKLRMPGIPPTFSRTPGDIRRLQPNLGEHSVEILGEAGFSAAEIDGLLKSGATRDGRKA
ncbi:MAG: CoA transferase [Alphaproteobacteria bacterium]|nr:CoA transferase [Alphaproteobacteria bacterium]